MTIENNPPLPHQACPICSGLLDQEYAYQKYGAPEYDSELPVAADQLEMVRDLQPYGSRRLELRRCPACETFYLYRTDYEYLTNGSEDEQFLTRLTPQQAAEYLETPIPEQGKP